MMKGLSPLRLCAVCLCLISFAPRAYARDGRVTFLMLNRIESQLLPLTTRVNINTIRMGGLAHAAGVVHEVREKDPNAILLLCGESVLGPLWRCFGGLPEFTSLSSIGIQAGIIGKHELDYGWEHFKNALQYIKFPLIASNVEISDPDVEKVFKKNIVVPYGDLKVGIFALLSPTLHSTAERVSEMTILLDLERIAREMVGDLQSQGADVIVMLSNLTGIENNRVADDVKGIHAIFGRSFETGEMGKPFLSTGRDDWLTAMVWGGAKAKFVGVLQFEMRSGRIRERDISWNLLNVTPQATPSPFILSLAAEYEEKLNRQLEKVLGIFASPIDARRKIIRWREAPIGSLVADSMRWRFNTDIAVINSGNIRGDKIFPGGPFSEKTLLEIFPYDNTVDIVTLTGGDVRRMMETSASALAEKGDNYDASFRTPSGGFLQVSGLRVSFDLARSPATFREDGSVGQWGSRVTDLAVLRDGEWTPVDDNAKYTAAVNSWIAGGGDRYVILKDAPAKRTGIRDMEVLLEYIRTFEGGRLDLQPDGRISFEK